MKMTTLAELAVMLAWFGALGMVVAVLNIVALHLVRLDDVPGYVRARIRWWSNHNWPFFLISLLLGVAGLTTVAAI
jgi:hypothetical protein